MKAVLLCVSIAWSGSGFWGLVEHGSTRWFRLGGDWEKDENFRMGFYYSRQVRTWEVLFKEMSKIRKVYRKILTI